MPTLYIIFYDMSSLAKFFSRSRFKLSFVSIISIYVGIFYPSGEPILLHLLRCGPIAVDDHVIMSDLLVRGNFKWRDVIASDRRECGNLNLLF